MNPIIFKLKTGNASDSELTKILGNLILATDESQPYLSLLPLLWSYIKPSTKTSTQVLAFNCITHLTRIYGIRCVQKLNELSPSAYIENALLASHSSELVESVFLYLIQVLSTLNAAKVQDKINVIAKLLQTPKRSLFKNFLLLDLYIQRQFLKSLLQFLNNFIGSSYYEVTQQIAELFTHQDDSIRELAIKIYDTIMKYLNVTPNLEITAENLAKQLNHANDYEIFAAIISKLTHLFKCSECFYAYEKIDIKFNQIMNNLENSKGSEKASLKAIVEFIKVISQYSQKESEKWISIYFSKMINYNSVFNTLSQSFSINDYIEQNHDSLIKSIHKSDNIEPFVNAISNLPREKLTKDMIIALNYANQKQKNEKYENFAQKLNIDTVIPDIHRIKTKDEFINLIDSISAFHILIPEYLKQILIFLKSDCFEIPTETLEKLLNLCFQSIKYIDLPKPVDPLPGKDVKTICNTFMQINIETEDAKINFIGSCDGYFSDLEGYINFLENGIESEKTIEMTTSKDWPRNIIISDKKLRQLKFLDMMLVHSIRKHPQAQFYSFSIGKYNFNSSCSIMRSVIASISQARSFQKTVATVKISPKQNDQQIVEQPSKYYQSSLIEPIISLIDAIHDVSPAINFRNHEFVKMIERLIEIAPSGAIAWCSYPVWIVKNHPYLFSTRMKHFCSTLLYASLPSAALAFSTHFNTPSPKIRCTRPTVSISSLNILADGLNVINYLRSQMIIPDIFMNREQSNMTEFLWRYSLDLLNLKVRDGSLMFIDDYIIPSCTAQDSFFFQLGILVAKAVSTSSCLGLPIHPAFFLAYRNKFTDSQNERLHKNLTHPDMQLKLKCFNDGFARVMSPLFLDAFDCDEISAMLYTKRRKISPQKDLASIHVSDLSADKTAIYNFYQFYQTLEVHQFERLMVRTVGAPHIPFGKLSCLYPPLTLAIGDINFVSLKTRTLQISRNSTPETLRLYVGSL